MRRRAGQRDRAAGHDGLAGLGGPDGLGRLGGQGFAIFGTPIGRCGIAWRVDAPGPRVLAVQLPERNPAATRARLARRVPLARQQDPPTEIRRVITAIRATLDGEMIDLSATPLDYDGLPRFHAAVYEAARTIPAGSTHTYGEVAALAGAPRAARAVGHALACNPFPLIVPCHRVLAATGIGGFSAEGGVATKRRLLALEGVDPPPSAPTAT